MLEKDKCCMSSLVHEILKTKGQRAKNIKKKKKRERAIRFIVTKGRGWEWDR